MAGDRLQRVPRGGLCSISPLQCQDVSDVWECLQVYNEPTVLLAKRVTGEEEVPEGCVAVVTPDAPDVLSHVSVRARNMRVLFAVCHESKPLEEIEKLVGKVRIAHAQDVHTSFQVPVCGAM